MKNRCVIVIPVHTAYPSANELSSFAQCFKILDKHPIKILAPQNLDLQSYKSLVHDFEVIFIEPIWQSSVEQYNKLKISEFFYQLFSEFEYLLTYELDAWVFKDDIEYWCRKSYSFIGAPWFEDYEKVNSTKIIGVGNSGFSLRNIQTSIKILNRIRFLKNIRKIWFKSYLQSIWRFSKMVLFFKKQLHIRAVQHIESLCFVYTMHEDYYWSHFIAGTFNDYNISEISDAIKFSFETNPSFLFKLNDNELPFGCHAWEKYEPDFWKKYIPMLKI